MDQTSQLWLIDGSVVTVDREDHQRAARHRWRWAEIGGYRYVVTYADINGRGNRATTLSRFLMDAPQGRSVFQASGDRTDFRKANLVMARPVGCICGTGKAA